MGAGERKMERKIELIQERENSNYWHWVILEYDSDSNVWYNVGSGLEESYEKASIVAKKEYDSL